MKRAAEEEAECADCALVATRLGQGWTSFALLCAESKRTPSIVWNGLRTRSSASDRRCREWELFEGSAVVERGEDGHWWVCGGLSVVQKVKVKARKVVELGVEGVELERGKAPRVRCCRLHWYATLVTLASEDASPTNRALLGAELARLRETEQKLPSFQDRLDSIKRRIEEIRDQVPKGTREHAHLSRALEILGSPAMAVDADPYADLVFEGIADILPLDW